MDKPVRVLVADDHFIIREGLRLIFDTTENITIAGEAKDGQEALEQVEELNPDVVLMDLQMPRMDGITAIETLATTHPNLPVVILTTYKENDLILRGLQAGANGYLLKDSGREILLETIYAAVRGETLVKTELLQGALSAGETTSQASPNMGERLTEREMEVLKRVAGGERNKEIAYHLGISERTVRAHLGHIFQKLNVDSRAAAVAEAAKLGHITL